MPTTPRRATPLLCLALALTALGVFLLAPAMALAQTTPGLQVGATASIANAGGDAVLLREGPGYDARPLNSFPEGTPVDLVDGPIVAEDGTIWFGVVVAGQSGYVVIDFLTPGSSTIPAAPRAPAAAMTTVETTAAAPLTVAQPAAPLPTTTTATTTTDVNLRGGPSYDDLVLTVIPAGSVVTPTGEAGSGFVGVAFGGQVGWVDAAYLGTDFALPAAAPVAAPVAVPAPAAESAPAAVPAPAPVTAPLTSDLVADPTTAPTGTGAVATSVVNLRAGPTDADSVLRVLPPGSPVTITGAAAAGFSPVWYNGTAGWIADAFLDTSGTTPAVPLPAAQPAPAAAERTGPATTIDAVNLRADPSVTATVLTTLPPGAAVEPTGTQQSGFYPVAYGGQSGWVSGAFLRFQSEPPIPADGPALEPPTLAPAANRGGGLIWPVTGDGWSISQGYNGSSHQNQSSLWQYRYSFDISHDDGAAGRSVVSPATGTVRWLDPSTGGISIDVGNGHAVALFHVTINGGLDAGDSVGQGQVIGSVSGSGGPGYAGFAHVHFTLWETTDGGNWSRVAAPFVGRYAVNGQEFPDTGGGNQYRGTAIAA